MNPIKVDINDLDKYFVKSELTPAIAFDVDTKTVLMLAYMNKAIHGIGADQDRNIGTRVQQAVICKR